MRPLALVGVAAVAVGFVAVVNRSIAAAIDPSTVVVTLIGALAVVQGFDTRTSAAAATGGPPTPASRSAGCPRPCPEPTSTSGSAE